MLNNKEIEQSSRPKEKGTLIICAYLYKHNRLLIWNLSILQLFRNAAGSL